MYPLPAVLIHNSDSSLEALRLALIENVVDVVSEFKDFEAFRSQWPAIPDLTKRMLVVRLRSLDDVNQMARLESSFPGWPLLAIVEGDVDAVGLYQVSRAGASQIVPYPFERKDFDAALDRLLLQFGLRESPCRVIAVTGVSEGSGTTSVSINLAAELAALGEVPVILTELSMGMGRLASVLSLSPITTMRDLLKDPAEPNIGSVNTALVHSDQYLSVLAEQTQSIEPFFPTLERLENLRRVLQQISTFLIIDLPNTFNPFFFEALSAAEHIFLVGRQDVPSMQFAKLIRTSLVEKGISTMSFIVNQFDNDLNAFSTTAISDLLQIKPVYSVASDISGFRAATNEGRLLRDVVPMSPAVMDVRSIAVTILEQAGIAAHVPHVGIKDRVKTFLSRLRN